jgi:hypothetical protein
VRLFSNRSVGCFDDLNIDVVVFGNRFGCRDRDLDFGDGLSCRDRELKFGLLDGGALSKQEQGPRFV